MLSFLNRKEDLEVLEVRTRKEQSDCIFIIIIQCTDMINRKL